jgi:hypothetical protein
MTVWIKERQSVVEGNEPVFDGESRRHLVVSFVRRSS